MPRPLTHAPDGGMMGFPLCESKQGDVADLETDVDCGDCLDLLEDAELPLMRRMARHGFGFTNKAPFGVTLP
ncbi:MAG: hypothetical protein JWM19_912 [Actinomycetia bacterium]|nr:hypothetical protein [Actinomycetes bacterium]